MIPVAEALDHLFALVSPLDAEEVPLRAAAGRVLATTLRAQRDQPPFAASAMDGYALAKGDAIRGRRLRIVGEAAAGHGFSGSVRQGEAVRIFTGAPLPPGTDHVEIQEDVTRDGEGIRLDAPGPAGQYVRPAGADFSIGDEMTPRRLSPADIALLAAMNHAIVPVTRKPVVALVATGDELTMPGERPRPDQIVASNTFGLAAMVDAAGGTARLLPIARDTQDSLASAFDLARGCDLIVTVGGASVGDHDLVAATADTLGMERAFYKVAMRPGKPLMAGRLSGTPLVGLPGNPVSAMVCGTIFLRPMIDVMLGLGARPAPRYPVRLAHDLPANGPREHYMRARTGPDGVAAADRQDSALLTILAGADALLVRPPHDPARRAGETVDIVGI
ncbi:MAG: molybdopterin molybdotransferase MoeA [Shimia sp.]